MRVSGKARLAAGVGAVGVGALTVLQSRINGELGAVTGSGIFTAWLSFLVGLVAIVVIVVARARNRASFALLRSAVRRGDAGVRTLNPWYILGGLGGATFVVAQSSTVQYLGVAIFTVAIVAAQNASSLAVDQVGLGPRGVQSVSLRRIVAAVVATGGVVVAVQGGGQSNNGASLVWPLAFALVAGCLIAVQQAVNGRVAVASGSPWIAGLANFVVGWLALSVVVVSLFVSGNLDVGPLPGIGQFYLYLGGLIGVAFIVVAAAAVHYLGVLVFALLSIAGQMVGALLVDVFLPEANRPITWQLIAGVVITGGAVCVATLARRQT